MSARFYAGVGSRKTPIEVQAHMTALATWFWQKGWTLRSGSAPGADAAFMRGAPIDRQHIFDPWSGYKGAYPEVPRHATAPEEWACLIAKSLHPNWTACGGGARSLHSRNVHQVLGLMNEMPSLFVVCWTSDGAQLASECTRDTGGTAMAIRVAASVNMPVFNLQRGDSELRAFMDHFE